MKLNRRYFIKLIPVGTAIAVASWLLWESISGSPSATVRLWRTTSATAKPFVFPTAWGGYDRTIVNLTDYRLRVDGDVSNPLELTIEDLNAMPTVISRSTISCVEGWNAEVVWEGIPLSRFLSRAGASEVEHVTVESVTGYTIDRPLDPSAFENPKTMIALKAGGLPLTVDHGYPARLVAPTRAGYEWVKYVGRITCSRHM
jgi:DMSO/TMAO reductase YedYZ molybdopterin-dependent catalytic subunit